MFIKKIISGGQTGVDRAALDVAIKLKMSFGGWCPKGMLAEDGSIPRHYHLKCTPSDQYEERTEWNVRDSEGTLVLTIGPLTGGTVLTVQYSAQHYKPCLVLDLSKKPSIKKAKEWIESNKIKILNVAGPRESKSPGIYRLANRFLARILA